MPRWLFAESPSKAEIYFSKLVHFTTRKTVTMGLLALTAKATILWPFPSHNLLVDSVFVQLQGLRVLLGVLGRRSLVQAVFAA